MLKAAVSGSFHRHMSAIYTAVGDLRAAGVNVLSPSDPRIVDHIGEFLFVASDRLRSIKLVQNRHFEAIRASDFLWVVCPDGYTGPSTSAEIGAAHVLRVPVFSDHRPLDITLQHYVTKVPSILAAVEHMTAARTVSSRRLPQILLDPDFAVDRSQILLEEMRDILTGRQVPNDMDSKSAVDRRMRILGETVGLHEPR